MSFDFDFDRLQNLNQDIVSLKVETNEDTNIIIPISEEQTTHIFKMWTERKKEILLRMAQLKSNSPHLYQMNTLHDMKPLEV